MGHESGVQFRVPRSRLHPLRQVPATSRRGQQIFKVELQFEFGDAIFLFELVHYFDFTISRSGDLIPRTLARTFHVATPLCLRRSPRLVPTCGVRISRYIPARLCAQEASSIAVLSIPTGQLRLWALQVRPAAQSVPLGLRPARIVSPLRPAAGPRATP